MIQETDLVLKQQALGQAKVLFSQRVTCTNLDLTNDPVQPLLVVSWCPLSQHTSSGEQGLPLEGDTAEEWAQFGFLGFGHPMPPFS